ncbi:hypothetical protein [Streptomyces sp. NPDC059828]
MSSPWLPLEIAGRANDAAAGILAECGRTQRIRNAARSGSG